MLADPDARGAVRAGIASEGFIAECAGSDGEATTGPGAEAGAPGASRAGGASRIDAAGSGAAGGAGGVTVATALSADAMASWRVADRVRERTT